MIVSLFGIGFDAVVNNDSNIYLLFICFTLFIIISSSRPAMSSSITVLLLGLTSCDSLLILTSILMFGKYIFYCGKLINDERRSNSSFTLSFSKQEKSGKNYYFLMFMTQCKINLTFQSQKPPNLQVFLEWF